MEFTSRKQECEPQGVRDIKMLPGQWIKGLSKIREKLEVISKEIGGKVTGMFPE